MLHDCRMAYLPFADEAAGVGMDLEVSLERALRAGAEQRFGPADAGDWRVAGICDSESNRIALQARTVP
ncbi:hypothetical protein [Stenotrophomonas maltophilia]|uniref:hypothetical protein n=1 Tax=Stenotrophomonas maltophilia TaxID=40324 RepID=UPI0021554C2C|nr:hypothetical protein [Stenotrophomonas maltophilia]